MDLNQIVDKALSRRGFLAGAGSVAAVTALAGCADDGTAVLPSTSSSVSEADVLNFALNLEYLEAEFYLRAATGSGLPTAMTTGTGTLGTVTGGTKITGLTSLQQNILNEIAYDEQQHVAVLRNALNAGSTPAAVARPAIDLTAFAVLATAAGIPLTGFNPFTTGFDGFLVGAFVFEDVGVTAYNGAAPLLSTPGYITAAAGIMAVEAYHAAYVRTALTGNAYAQGTTAYPYFTFANQVATLRGKLGGTATATYETLMAGPAATPITVVTSPVQAPSAIVAADSNALAFARSTDQVLHIVYGTFSNTAGSTTPAAGVSKGGFFPSGLNGNLSVTKS